MGRINSTKSNTGAKTLDIQNTRPDDWFTSPFSAIAIKHSIQQILKNIIWNGDCTIKVSPNVLVYYIYHLHKEASSLGALSKHHLKSHVI